MIPALFAIGGIAVMWKRRDDERAAFAIAVITALLTTPILWLHYLVLASARAARALRASPRLAVVCPAHPLVDADIGAARARLANVARARGYGGSVGRRPLIAFGRATSTRLAPSAVETGQVCA